MEGKVYLASDHAGFLRKEEIKGLLKSKRMSFEDVGPDKFDAGDDYPDFGDKAIEAVKKQGGVGILICDTGIGMDILANKHRGIRAALATNAFMAKRSRLHNDANVLVLGEEVTDWSTTEQIVMTFLLTPFSGEERHIRRLKKIEQMESEHA